MATADNHLFRVQDLSKDAFELAVWLGARFTADGSWPLQREVQIECYRREVDFNQVVTLGTDVFHEITHPKNGTVSIGLAIWVLWDMEVCPKAFEIAGKLLDGSLADMARTGDQAYWSRARVAEDSLVAVGDVVLRQLFYILKKSKFHATAKENDDWEAGLGFHYLKFPKPSFEECPSAGAHPRAGHFWPERCVQLTGAAAGSAMGAAG